MRRKHSYSALSVERVDTARLISAIGKTCVVGVDVAKERFVAAIASRENDELLVVRFRHPEQTREFVELLDNLRKAGISVVAGMEPTGTYGDALRGLLARRGFEVRNVSPKATHDAAEVFDGVPSMHDGKSAVIITQLCKLGRSEAWPIAPEETREVRALLEQRRRWEGPREQDYGVLEAQLARHWPEFGSWMDVRDQKSALVLLREFGGPDEVARRGEEARDILRRASRGNLSAELINGTLLSAAETLGLPPTREEKSLIQLVAKRLLDASAEMDAIEARIEERIVADSPTARMAAQVGTYTAAVIATFVEPTRYPNARAFEKACGLNLREKSSGEDDADSNLQITKRGPPIVRKLLYLAALRMLSQPIVQAWYKRRKGWTDGTKMRAVVAVMRKLIKALWHVARGTVFDPTKLFDIRRLEMVEAPKVSRKIELRRTSRSPVRRRRNAKEASAM